MIRKAIHTFCDFLQAETVTANAADVISTKTPVAYAPPCEVTSARNKIVTKNAIAVKTRTNGRVARAQSGAIPNRGKYRGTIFRSPAIADAPANQRIVIVLMS